MTKDMDDMKPTPDSPGAPSASLAPSCYGPPLDQQLSEVAKWACCGEPERRVRAEHELCLFLDELAGLLGFDLSRLSWLSHVPRLKEQMIKNEIINLLETKGA